MELTDKRAKPAVLFRRQVAHHRFRAVQCAQFRHPAHRRRHPIQGAQPDPPSAARLELPAPRAQRELRHPAGRASGCRRPMVRSAPPTPLPEHRHHRELRAALHRHAGRRPRLQDGLRADAAASTSNSGADVTVGCIEVPRMEAERLRRHADRRDRPHHSLPRKAGGPARHARQAATWRWPAWASMSSKPQFLIDHAAARRRRSEIESRFRQGHHPRSWSRNGNAIAHRFAESPACARATEAEAYWRDVGTIDAYWEANIDLTDFVPGARPL